MIALTCSHDNHKKSGKNRNGSQRYRCTDCKKYFSDEHVNTNPLGSMRIDTNKAMMVIGALLEGMSIRGASRLFSVDRDTIARLILEAGERCQKYMDTNIVNAPVESIQLDELWSKIYSSDRVKKIKGTDADDEHGSSWTYVCLTDKKLAIHHVGKRDQEDTITFLHKVRRGINTSKPFQCSSDGWASYLYGVPFTLGSNVKQLVAEFQQSQIQYTMKNGDREQTLNRLINDKNVVEATSLENEMFSEFDQTMLSLNKKVEASVLPHQLKRLHQIAKQQVLMNRTPFRDEFGVALAIVAELDTAKKTRNEISKRIATRRRELLDEIEKLRAQARKDVVAAFPKEHRKLIADVYAQYYDVEKNRRASSEAKYENWKIAR